MVRLPVSGRAIDLRPPTGADEVALLDAPGDTAAALELARRLSPDADGAAWTPTDLDAFVLHARRAVLGDAVRTDTACPAAGCGARIDIGFGVAAYLASRVPEPAAEAVPDEEEPGWLRFPRGRVRFRLVSVADQLAVEGLPDAAAELARRCVRGDPTAADLNRVREELERLAPEMSGTLTGVCPECGAAVEAFFDPRAYCVAELRALARFVFDDVDAIARRYHWAERDILALPSVRRAAYARLAAGER